jgi:tRNA-uridine 2-sulfurtransferase
MSNKNSPLVFVGLSGGVDSSVAALRLKKQGYDVVGVFIKVWHPDFLVCNWEQERLDAMRVAAHLDIPFLTCDAESAYRDEVARYFIDEYIAGRTPNPDVMCNKHVKFGAFLEFAKDHGADYIATGHYARRVDDSSSSQLYRGVDPNKDQSYFLWTLTPEQLAYTLLPVGDTVKDTIRYEAGEAKIPTAQKKDSQGICFLGQVDIKDFLQHYTKLEVGKVLNEQGEVIGTHEGALVYTPGQRHGLTINTHEESRQPYFVVSKNLDQNTVTVSTTKPTQTERTEILLTNIVLRQEVKVGELLSAQSRYRQEPFPVEILSVSETKVTLRSLAVSDKIVVGQSCVLYKDNCCVGGGIIA